jgi:hypothetical protein
MPYYNGRPQGPHVSRVGLNHSHAEIVGSDTA